MVLPPTCGGGTGALFSEDGGGQDGKGDYRYLLWREVNGPAQYDTALFIGLNPSTADETENDPTIRRCMGYARKWGFRCIYMANIFGYRSTDWTKLKTVDDPVGRLNSRVIMEAAEHATIIVCAWGTHGALGERGKTVRALLVNGHHRVHVLGLTKAGFPKHPLYLKGDLRPMPWIGSSELVHRRVGRPR